MIARMSEAEAFETFKALRWPSTGGKPVCPDCGHPKVYEYNTRRIFKCAQCGCQFSVTSKTIFASHKRSLQEHLSAALAFANGAKGKSALEIRRSSWCSHSTAFVFEHKLREAMALETKGAALSGVVEIDGLYAGGYVKKKNWHYNRKDRRKAKNL